jgi:hypothetical protein
MFAGYSYGDFFFADAEFGKRAFQVGCGRCGVVYRAAADGAGRQVYYVKSIDIIFASRL